MCCGVFFFVAGMCSDTVGVGYVTDIEYLHWLSHSDPVDSYVYDGSEVGSSLRTVLYLVDCHYSLQP